MQNWTTKQKLIFIIQWFLWTYAAFLIYFNIVKVITQPIYEILGQQTWALISSVALGSFMGYMQWLTIRKLLPKTALWIPVTGLAWLLTFAAMQRLIYILEINIDYLKMYWLRQPPPFLRVVLSIFYGPTYFSELDVLIGLSLILGLCLGLAQFAILKPHVQKPLLWILLNIVASYLSYRFAFSLPNNYIQPFIFFPLHALLTGIAMSYMLWKHKK